MPPTAPPSIPNYLADGLPKQDDETLREVQEYVDELLAAREQRRSEPVSEDELPDDAQVLENESDGAVYLEYRTMDGGSGALRVDLLAHVLDDVLVMRLCCERDAPQMQRRCK